MHTIFKDFTFFSGTMVGAVMFAMLMAVTFLLPLFMQTLLGYTAEQSGLALLPGGFSLMLLMPYLFCVGSKNVMNYTTELKLPILR